MCPAFCVVTGGWSQFGKEKKPVVKVEMEPPQVEGSLELQWAVQAPLAGRQHHPASWDLGDSQGVHFIQLIKLPIYGLFNFWYLCYISQ